MLAVIIKSQIANPRAAELPMTAKTWSVFKLFVYDNGVIVKPIVTKPMARPVAHAGLVTFKGYSIVSSYPVSSCLGGK